MSRREDSWESKRHHSRFDREPRRDDKPETERPTTEPELDKDRPDRDHRDRRRLQDPLPLETGSKVESGNMAKHSSDLTKVPQSRSYFQHDDRACAGQNGTSFSRRTDSERGWWRDPKEQQNDRSTNKTVPSDIQQKDEKSKDKREGNHVWLHDGYFEMEANLKPSIRKRPSFRKQKIPADPGKTSKAAADPVIPNSEDLAIESGRRNERGHNSRHADKTERPFVGERDLNEGQSWRGNFSSRERYGANNSFRGRDRFSARQGQGYRPSGARVEKWKHDLYEEANRRPPPKNEEDQISKIEALLAS